MKVYSCPYCGDTFSITPPDDKHTKFHSAFIMGSKEVGHKCVTCGKIISLFWTKPSRL